jgi:hypothetical protein
MVSVLVEELAVGGEQALQVLGRVADEAHAVVDELDRRVDLVGDPGRELAHGLESLGDALLGLDPLALALEPRDLGDVGIDASTH